MELLITEKTQHNTSVSTEPFINPFDSIEHDAFNTLKSNSKLTATFSINTVQKYLQTNNKEDITTVMQKYMERAEKEKWDFGDLTSENFKNFLI